ncbi:ribosomal RNA small subunit methyltransferase G [Tepiditoga spiralis]|uniref:Ribosomal RNA small subunit methyltransferase G n=1 Tax=Tepiditoga spiralis TaxID=2108365 RepID=A0A7G1G9G1_9BACT|nr:16S rRNA (guanine(527)-N(7))-methyltransferase RsmG [Tepiditoga spiralis]BBE30682.1 ribosomal RNA small subunit methyltransferase G [Tepiditoga spiralis]
MILNKNNVNFLQSYDIPKEKQEKLIEYTKMLIEYKSNLTSIKDINKAFEYHIIDSLTPFLKITLNGKRFVDVGTGGGVPGIPLAICYPDINFFLVESIKKKTNALKIFKDVLNLDNVFIFNSRIEEFANNHKDEFDYGTCRALARADVALEYTVPLIKKFGKVFLYKGPAFKEEEKLFADKASQILKVIQKKIIEYSLSDKKRFLIEYEKYDETPNKYPRKTGIPLKRPLGGKI